MSSPPLVVAFVALSFRQLGLGRYSLCGLTGANRNSVSSKTMTQPNLTCARTTWIDTTKLCDYRDHASTIFSPSLPAKTDKTPVVRLYKCEVCHALRTHHRTDHQQPAAAVADQDGRCGHRCRCARGGRGAGVHHPEQVPTIITWSFLHNM